MQSWDLKKIPTFPRIQPSLRPGLSLSLQLVPILIGSDLTNKRALFANQLIDTLHTRFWNAWAFVHLARHLNDVLCLILSITSKRWITLYSLTLSLLVYLKTRIRWGGGSSWPPSKSHVWCPNMTNDTSLESSCALLLESAKNCKFAKIDFFFCKIQLYTQ